VSIREDRAWDARQDRIADDQAERETAELRADRRGFEVGDRVTVGKGRTVWTIGAFWGDRGELASLEPVDGYSGTSVHVDRLRAVR
jgi:hypothetical protein